MIKILNFLKCRFVMGNSLKWATDGGCKELLKEESRKWLFGLSVERAIDIASGSNCELENIVPECKEFHYLDNLKLPAKKINRYHHFQKAGEKINVESNYFDLAITNGSFDHFTQIERERSFHEIARILKPGGRFLFACEYFDFSDKDHFKKSSTDIELIKMNCQYYDNINLKRIIDTTKKLKIIQKKIEAIPDGRPLNKMINLKNIKKFQSVTKYGLKNTWAAFFCVFVK